MKLSQKQELINYYVEYFTIKENCSQEALNDIYGFLISKTCPSDKTHSYYIFEKLEDRYSNLLYTLKKEWVTGVPCIQYLLEVELGIENNINNKFYECIQTVKEE